MKICLLSHSFIDKYEGPAEQFASFLLKKRLNFYLIQHPLNRDSFLGTKVSWLEDSATCDSRLRKRRVKFPFSLIFDFFHTPRLREFDVVIVFNFWAATIARLRTRQNAKIVFWGVDFDPKKYNSVVISRLMICVERFAFKRVMLHIENNPISLAARRNRVKATSKLKSEIVPITIPIEISKRELFPKGPLSVVYFGSINERNGVPKIIEIVRELEKRTDHFQFLILGGGALLEELKSLSKQLNLEERLHFSGYLQTFHEASVLANNSQIAIAPYSGRSLDYTYYADPGKVAWYCAMGLPIIMTDAVGMSEVYAKEAGAIVIAHDSSALKWAETIMDLYENRNLGLKLSRMVQAYANSRDEEKVFSSALDIIFQNTEGVVS